MDHPSRTAHIEELADELIALFLAQAADSPRICSGRLGRGRNCASGTNPSPPEIQRAEHYREFEQAAFPVSLAPDRADQTKLFRSLVKINQCQG